MSPATKATAHKSAPKKRATSTRTTKVSPKKQTVKKTAAKAVRKKVVKKVVRKRVLKKKAVKASAKKEKTLKPRKKATISDTFSKGEKKPFSFPQSVSLAIIAMPKLPVDVDTLAINMARYGGMAMVVVGACFSIFYAQASGLQFPQLPNMMAEVISGVAGSTTETGLESEHEEKHHPLDINPRPPVGFEVSDQNPKSEDVQVRISVPYAKKVTIFAFHLETQEYILLGQADNLNTIEWGLTWDTLQYLNGKYKLKAVVINEFGSYDRFSDQQFYVSNSGTAGELEGQEDRVVEDETIDQEEETELTVDTSSQNANLTGDEEETEAGTVEASTESSIDNGITSGGEEQQQIDVFPDELEALISFSRKEQGVVSVLVRPNYRADTVFLKAIHRETGTLYDLGKTTNTSDQRWRFEWDTTNKEEGIYAVFAVITRDNNDFISKKFNFEINADIQESVEVTASSVEGQTSPTDQTTEKNIATEKVEDESFVIEVELPGGGPFSDLMTITISAPEASFVEVFARSDSARDGRFAGLAKKTSAGDWRFLWNTTNVPNGQYVLKIRAKFDEKFYEKVTQQLLIQNEIIAFKDDIEGVQERRLNIESDREEIKQDVETVSAEIAKENAAQIKQNINDETKPKPSLAEQRRLLDLSPERLEQSIVLSSEDLPDPIQLDDETEEIVEQEIESILATYRVMIDKVMQGVATAVRSGDDIAISLAKENVAKLRNEILDEVTSSDRSAELVSFIDNRLSRELARLKVRTEASEKLINERVDTDLSRDSDNDGITDYDEINLYQTDPLAADSDNDGFVDGVEILSGYNPRDASVEAVVQYESPKEAGIVREDILVVEAITTLTLDASTSRQNKSPEAVISGRALPNSFVTLYVFSNPVVVTVKTDADGNWSYKFDKEIEDGTHEVYVGVTDNAGRVVAKSQPVQFVKTAEAFTPVDAAEEVVVAQTESKNTLINSGSLLLIASISVVAIGLILILLGLHLQGRREEEPDFITDSEPATA